jgi:hypothetical protein
MSVVDEPGHDPEDMVHIVVTAAKERLSTQCSHSS